MRKTLLFCAALVAVFFTSTSLAMVYGEAVTLNCYPLHSPPEAYICFPVHVDGGGQVPDPDPSPPTGPVPLFYKVCAECHAKKLDWTNKSDEWLREQYFEKRDKAKGKHASPLP